MFSENGKISGRQMNRLLILDLFAVSCMVLPRLLPDICGRQGFFAVAAGAGAAILSALLYTKTARCYTDNFFAFARRQTAAIPAVIFALFFMIKFLLSAVFVLKMFSEIINRTFLTEMHEKVIAALMILTALYSVSKGIETRGRLGELLFWAVLIPIIVVVILSAAQIVPDRIFPMTADDAGEIFDGTLLTAAIFSVFEFLLFSMPYVRGSRPVFHFCAWAAAAAAALTIFIYVACIGVLSVEGAGAEHWPTVILMQVIRFPGYFLSRQDGLMLAFWMGSVFILLSGYIFYTDELTKQLFPKKYFKGTMILWLILVYGLFWLIQDYGRFEAVYWRLMTFAGMPVSLLISAWLLISCKFKRGKEGGRA